MSAIIFGFIVGVVFGLTGGGGGVFTTPFLVYGLNVPIHQAIGITLITLSFTGMAGLLKRSRTQVIDWRVGVVISITGIISSLIGSKLNNLISESVLSFALSVSLILISVLLWRNASHKNKEIVDAQGKHYFKLCLIGIIAGFLNGLLGISGGIIVVSSLILFMSFPMRQAASVSILVVAIISTVSAVSHFYFSPRVVDSVSILFVLSSMGGMIVASHFSNILPEAFLKRALAVLVFFVGSGMLIKCLI